MSKHQDDQKWVRAYTTLKQQLDGAEAAACGRGLRVPKGMWKRGGGKKGSDVTHYEAAHTNFAKGRTRAIAGGYLKAKEAESFWFRFGFYSTINLLELLGDRVDTALIGGGTATPAAPRAAATPPEPRRIELVPAGPKQPSGPKHGEVGHKMKVSADAWVEVVGDRGTASLWFH